MTVRKMSARRKEAKAALAVMKSGMVFTARDIRRVAPSLRGQKLARLLKRWRKEGLIRSLGIGSQSYMLWIWRS